MPAGRSGSGHARVCSARATASAFELVEPGIARETSEGADGTLWMTDPVHGARRQGARAPVIGLDGWGMRLLHDSRGNLWVGTTGQGLWRVRDHGSRRAADRARDHADGALERRRPDAARRSRRQHLGRHDARSAQPDAAGRSRRSRPAPLVRAILPEPDSSMWVGTASGLLQFRHDGGAWRGRTVSEQWDIRSLFRDARGQAWATTDHGIRAAGSTAQPADGAGAGYRQSARVRRARPECRDGARSGCPAATVLRRP